MKVRGYQHEVKVNLTFTAEEIGHLICLANRHYAVECRMVTRSRGLLCGLDNQLWGRSPSDPATVDASLTIHQLSTLVKICEIEEVSPSSLRPSLTQILETLERKEVSA